MKSKNDAICISAVKVKCSCEPSNTEKICEEQCRTEEGEQKAQQGLEGAEWIMALAAKSEDLILRNQHKANVMEGENPLPQVVLWPPHASTCVPTNTQISVMKKVLKN